MNMMNSGLLQVASGGGGWVHLALTNPTKNSACRESCRVTNPEGAHTRIQRFPAGSSLVSSRVADGP